MLMSQCLFAPCVVVPQDFFNTGGYMFMTTSCWLHHSAIGDARVEL